MFSQKLFFKSSLLLNGSCSIQVRSPTRSGDHCFLFCFYPSSMVKTIKKHCLMDKYCSCDSIHKWPTFAQSILGFKAFLKRWPFKKFACTSDEKRTLLTVATAFSEHTIWVLPEARFKLHCYSYGYTTLEIATALPSWKNPFP